MTEKQSKNKNRLLMVYTLFCGLLCLCFYCLSAGGFLADFFGSDSFYSINVKAADAITQKPGVVSPNIYVIGIDEDSLRELGVWSKWDRGIMAQMLETLNANPNARPAVIGVDVSYFGETDPLYDNRLAQAAQDAGNVVMAAEVTFADMLQYDPQGKPYIQRMGVSGIDYPYPALKQATKQGIINTIPEQDGVIRNSIHTASFGGDTLDSFGYTIYRAYAAANNLPLEVSPPLDGLNRWHIPFTGESGDYYGGNSFVRVLDGSISAELFAGSIVLIGPYATGTMDQYYTPIDTGKMMYGVEIHANIIEALLNQNFKQPLPLWMQGVLVFVSTAVGFWIFYRIEPQYAILLLIGIIALYLGAVVMLYAKGFILDVIYIPTMLAVSYIYRVVSRYFWEKARRQAVTNTFKRYMEPQVVEHLLKDGAAQLNMSGIKRDIAVLFVDIRGFTTMSESLETAQVVGILNDYLTLASNKIFSNKGTLDKYIGDAAMAIFNAPLDLEDYTFRAVKTAIDIAKGSQELQEGLMQKFGRSISFGIGVHCGEAIVGNIGADFRMDYTAIGDTVNTAARLESNAKAGQILISSQVYERVKGRVNATELGMLTLKGKTNSVLTYLVEGLTEQ